MSLNLRFFFKWKTRNYAFIFLLNRHIVATQHNGDIFTHIYPLPMPIRFVFTSKSCSHSKHYNGILGLEAVAIMQAPNFSWPAVSHTSNLISPLLIWSTRVHLHTQGDYILLLKVTHQVTIMNVVFLMQPSCTRMNE